MRLGVHRSHDYSYETRLSSNVDAYARWLGSYVKSTEGRIFGPTEGNRYPVWRSLLDKIRFPGFKGHLSLRCHEHR